LIHWTMDCTYIGKGENCDVVLTGPYRRFSRPLIFQSARVAPRTSPEQWLAILNPSSLCCMWSRCRLTPGLNPEFGGPLLSELSAQREAEARKALEAFLADRFRNMKVKRLVRSGDPAQEIVE